jgi:hypothetical protein
MLSERGRFPHNNFESGALIEDSNFEMVRSGSGDKAGASAGDGRDGPVGVSPAPPPQNYVTSTPSPGEGMCRGRFWALAELEEEPEAGDEDTSDGVPVGVLNGAIQRSPVPSPSRSISQGDFISRAEELGGSFRHGKRAAFAPGGRGSRFQGGSPAARFSRLGDDGWVVRGRRRAVSLPVLPRALAPACLWLFLRGRPGRRRLGRRRPPPW